MIVNVRRFEGWLSLTSMKNFKEGEKVGLDLVNEFEGRGIEPKEISSYYRRCLHYSITWTGVCPHITLACLSIMYCLSESLYLNSESGELFTVTYHDTDEIGGTGVVPCHYITTGLDGCDNRRRGLWWPTESSGLHSWSETVPSVTRMILSVVSRTQDRSDCPGMIPRPRREIESSSRRTLDPGGHVVGPFMLSVQTSSNVGHSLLYFFSWLSI